MKRIITLLIIFSSVLSLSAQNNNSFDEKKYSNVVYDATGTPILMELQPNYVINFVYNLEKDETYNPGAIWLRDELGLSEENTFKLIKKEEDKLGFVHYRFQQLYKGIVVDGSVYLVHTKNDKVLSVNGHVKSGISVNTKPTVNEATGLSNAIEYIGANTYRWQVEKTNAPVAELIIIKAESGFNVTYKYDIYAYEPLSRNDVFVDIHSGEVVLKRSKIFHADEVGTGVTKYSGTQTITTFNDGSNYVLKETGRNIETYNLNNSQDYNGATTFTNSTNTWDLGSTDNIAIDAHFGAEITYDYYLDVHDRKSIDGNGLTLKSYVHFGSNFGNAFWDGERMTYGDGDANVGPLTTPDICTHEITHGLVQYTAGLQQGGESGSLNESFCDIFAVLAEQHAFPSINDSLNFIIGEQVIDGAIRSMRAPKDNDGPDTYKGTNWDESGQKGAHNNGLVQGHWFYLLVLGGEGTNDNSDDYKVTGIGRDKAGDIVYRSLSVYLTPESDFKDARLFSIQAAKDLYGGCSDEVKQVTNAWYAVGIGEEYSENLSADFDFKVIPCSSPYAVQFINLSTGHKSSSWNFGDGTTSTESSPVHEYVTPGTYSVSLYVEGCIVGTDLVEKPDIIKADNGISCDTAQLTRSGNGESNSCYGVLFDSGGENGNHQSNANGTFTIAPDGASKVTLTFNTFEYGAYNDVVRVYDGASTSDPILGTFDFFTPPTGPIESTGGVITIQESTDGFTDFDGSGFSASWECESTVSVDDVNEQQVSVYPNPSNGVFNVSINKGSIDKYAIFNSIGEKILEFTPEDNINQLMINLNDKPAGVYHLILWSGDNTYTFNIVSGR